MLTLPHLCSLAAKLQKPIAVIDLETTGFIKPGVVEIACLKATGDGNVFFKSTLVDPQCNIDSRASAVHGIKAADVRGQKSLDKHLDFLAHLARTCVISGFNVITYDVRVLRDNAARYAHAGIPKTQAIDLRDIWKSVSGGSKGKLVDLAQHYGVQVENAHRALGDVIMTAKILDVVIERHGVDAALKALRDA